MSWPWRLLAWSALLAVPCWLLMPHYQRALTAVVNGILALFYRDGVTVDVLEIAAPGELGLFVALCLAGGRASRRARRFAITVGVPAIVAVELLLVVAAMVLVMSVPREGALHERAMRMNLYLLRSVPWAAAIMVWYALLGPRELPAPRTDGDPAR